MSTHNNQKRHILDSRLLRGFYAGRRDGGIGLVDDLAIEGLDFVLRRRHLVDKDLLHGVSVGDDVSVE